MREQTNMAMLVKRRLAPCVARLHSSGRSIGGTHFIGFDSRQSGDGADLGPLKDPIVIRPGWYHNDLFLLMTIAFSIGH